MSTIPETRSPGLFRKLLKIAGWLVLSMVSGVVALLVLGLWLGHRDADARAAADAASAANGEECRSVGEGDARTTVCVKVQDGTTTTTLRAD